MANLVTVSLDKTHASVQQIVDVLTNAGHTVTVENIADVTNVDLETYDAIICIRMSNVQTEIDKVTTAFNNGTPVVEGVNAGVTTGSSANGTGINVGLFTNIIGSGPDLDTLLVVNEFNFFNSNTQNTAVGIRSSNDYHTTANPPFADDVITCALSGSGDYYSNSCVSILACEKGSVTMTAVITQARYVFCGTLYGIQTFTPDYEAVLSNIITWLTSTPPAIGNITGQITLDDAPKSIDVIAVKADVNNPEVLGSIKSSPSDGGYAIPTDYQGEVIVFTIQDYGSAWEASTALSIDDYIHPTVPNGYIYKVTVAGTTGATEPTWATNGGETVIDGGVTFVTEILIEPGIAGYTKATF